MNESKKVRTNDRRSVFENKMKHDVFGVYLRTLLKRAYFAKKQRIFARFIQLSRARKVHTSKFFWRIDAVLSFFSAAGSQPLASLTCVFTCPWTFSIVYVIVVIGSRAVRGVTRLPRTPAGDRSFFSFLFAAACYVTGRNFRVRPKAARKKFPNRFRLRTDRYPNPPARPRVSFPAAVRRRSTLTCVFFVSPISAADAVQISELLSKTIADAHARTCFYTLDQIHDGMYRTATMATANKNTADKLHFYKTMVRILWLGLPPYPADAQATCERDAVTLPTGKIPTRPVDRT